MPAQPEGPPGPAPPASEPHEHRQVAESFGADAGGIREAAAFSDPEQWRFGWDRPYTRDEWLEQVPTFGGHNQLPAARQQEILAGIGAAVDALGGSFTMHYTTVAVTAARTSAARA